MALHTNERTSPLASARDEEINLQCPFTWEIKSNSQMICKMEEKLLLEEEEESTPWAKIIYNLILSYELANIDKIDEAFLSLEQCEKIIEDSEIDDSSKLVKGKALQHICMACRFHLLRKKQLQNESQKIRREITKVEEMLKKDHAIIYGVQCAVYMEYGLNGAERSIPVIEQAIQLDADCGEWYYLLGKALTRLRYGRKTYWNFSQREIQALERSVELSKNPEYMVLLAQSLIDLSRWVHFNCKNSGTNLDEMNIRARDLCRQAAENAPNNIHILGKCADGLARLSEPWRDTELAEKYILRALEIAPDHAPSNLKAGKIFSKKDNSRAKMFFQKAIEHGNFSAIVWLMKMKFNENSDYNPCNDIERYLHMFKEKHQKALLYAIQGAFHYEFKKDFTASFRCWWKIIEEDIHDKSLTFLYLPWKHGNDGINVNEIIILEIKKHLKTGRYSEEDKAMYHKVLTLYRENCPAFEV